MTLVGMEETEKQGLLTVHRPMKKPNWFYLLERNGHQNAVDGFLGAFRGEGTQRSRGQNKTASAGRENDEKRLSGNELVSPSFEK